MSEFVYDPALGGAVEVTRGINNPNQDQQDVLPEGPSVEELDRHRLTQTVKGLSQRSNHTHTFGESDANLETEIALQQAQQRLYRQEFSSPLEEQALIQQCETLAASLTNSAPTNQQNQQVSEDFDQEYRNANPEVEADLAYAAEVLGPSLIEDLNTNLDSDDELERVAALDVVKHLRQSPQAFVSHQESTGISQDVEASIAAEFGAETAHNIAILGNSIAQGLIKPSDAIRTASQDPALLRALMSGAQKGLFRIAL